MAPDPKRWSRTALGSLLVAFGGAMLGVKRKPPPAALSKRTPTPAKSGKPQAARPPAAPPQHWPPASNKGRQAPRPTPPVAAKPAPAPRPPEGSAALGYELRDTRPGILGIVMLLSVLIIAGSVAGLFALIGHWRAVDAAGPPLTAEQRAAITPPGPALQDHPFVDIAAQRHQEDALLHAYAWADASHRHARIPIERAVALVLGKPLDPTGPDAAP